VAVSFPKGAGDIQQARYALNDIGFEGGIVAKL